MKLEKIVLLNCAVLFTVFWFIRLPLSPDEAHYYLWSQNLDWSYYSKGPLLALVIKWSTMVFGKSEHSVRLPSLIFAIGSMLLIFRYLRNDNSLVEKNKVYLIIFSSVAMWYQALVMTTDAPTIFFWLLSCLSFKEYLDYEQNIRKLILGSVALGLGIWSKYTILVVLVIFSIFLLKLVIERRRPIYHLIVYPGIVLIFIIPILYWNHLNDWVNFQHNAGHVGLGKLTRIRPLLVFDFIGGQVGMYGLFFFPMFYFATRFLKQKVSQGTLFIFLSAATLFLICVAVSFTKRVYPNWAIPAYPLIVLAISEVFSTNFLKNRKTSNIFLGINGIITLVGILLMFGFTLGLPGKFLPTKKMVGWRDFSSFVLDSKLRHPEIELIISESYDFTSELNFYVPSLDVYNTTLGGRRMNQFDIWQKNNHKLIASRGKPVLLVLSTAEAVELFKPYFSEIEELKTGNSFFYDFSGELLRTGYLFYAFDYNGESFEEAIAR